MSGAVMGGAFRVACSLLLLALAGCGATATINQAGHFADAGIAYADAVPAFYDESFVYAATANSLILAQTRDDLPAAERGETLGTHDAELSERLTILRDLKAHAATLRAYFIALKALAQTDAGGEISDATQGLVDRLGKLSPTISGANIGGTPIADFIQPAVSLAVAAYQSAALRHEVEERGAAIERELALQEAAVAAIGEQMLADWDLQVQIEQRNPLTRAFISDAPLPGNWSDRRIELLRLSANIDSFNAASKAADSLHQSWIAFAEGRLGEDGLLLLLRDVEELVQLATKLKAQTS